PRRSSNMPTNKRASMREGPLAALFRKTAEEGPEQDKTPPREGGETQSSTPAPQTPAARAETPAPPAPEPRSEPEPPAAEPRPEVPSPQERLRQAFSSDIPSSLLEPPVRSKPKAPAGDPYARPERSAE